MQKNAALIEVEGCVFVMQHIAAARQKRRIGEMLHCELTILKARSPSCGSGKIYDGSFSGKLTADDGVTAALLKSQGLRVITEEELTGGKSVPPATEKHKGN